MQEHAHPKKDALSYEDAILMEMWGATRCEICEERFKPDPRQEIAEMYSPDERADGTFAAESVICHADCGLSRGYEVA